MLKRIFYFKNIIRKRHHFQEPITFRELKLNDNKKNNIDKNNIDKNNIDKNNIDFSKDFWKMIKKN